MNDEQINAYIDAHGNINGDSNNPDEYNGILYIEYNYKQLKLTNVWLEEVRKGIGDLLTFRREVLLQRLHGSDASPFDRTDIEYIIQIQKEPIDELWVLDYYKFDIYTKLDKRLPYLVGIDCATGDGSGDNNAITILDPFTKEPAAEFECNYIGETKFERLIISLVMDHLPKAVLCIERNHVGDSLIDHLLNSPIAGNLYYDKARDLVGETMKDNQTVESLLKKQASLKRYYGVYTERESRESMIQILIRHMNEYKDKFITKNITRDICNLVRIGAAGKIAAMPGKHDDSVMSYLITLYVLYNGNNLTIFGIYLGARDQDLNNQGLKRPEEINPNLVDEELLNAAKRQELLEEQKELYENMYRTAIAKSQEETYMLQKKGLITNSIYDNTPEGSLDIYDYSPDLDIFDELNGAVRNSKSVAGNFSDLGMDPWEASSYGKLW